MLLVLVLVVAVIVCVGMVVVVSADDADKAIDLLAENGESAWQVGRIVAGKQEVAYT